MTNGKKLKMLDMISKTVADSDYYVEVSISSTKFEPRYRYKIIAGQIKGSDNFKGNLVSSGFMLHDGELEIECDMFVSDSQDFFKLMEAYMMIPLMIQDKWGVEIEGW